MCVKKRCWECNEVFVVTNPTGDQNFCCAAHRHAWNNRRKSRGADLIDVFMALRFDRETAKEHQAWSIMCRMASNWRAEDKEANRRSFAPLQTLRERHLLHVSTRHGRAKSVGQDRDGLGVVSLAADPDGGSLGEPAHGEGGLDASEVAGDVDANE